MKQLTKIIFVQWYLFDAVEIPVCGHTAIVGGNGAGKSSIIDGVQVVLAGGDKTKIALNKGSNEKSSRTIREYCLGMVSDAKSATQIQPRERANSYVVLCFEDSETGDHICAGIAIWSCATELKEDIRGLFLTQGRQLSLDDFTEDTKDGKCAMTWERVRERLTRQFRLGSTLDLPNKGPTDFRRRFYTLMSAEPGMPMNPDTAIKSLLTSIAFKPINDPTRFVRENMLDNDNINLRELRESLDFWREFRDKAKRTEDNIKTLKQLEKSCQDIADAILNAHHHEHASLAARVERCHEIAEPAQSELDDIEEDLATLTEEEDSLTAEIAGRQEELWKRNEDLKQQDVSRQIEQLKQKRTAVDNSHRQTTDQITVNHSRCKTMLDFDDLRSVTSDDVQVAVAKLMRMATTEDQMLGGSWLNSPAEFDCYIADVLKSYGAARPEITRKNGELWGKIAPRKEEIKELGERIARLRKGVSPVGSHTTALIEFLSKERIAAQPLCDLVNITDERWRNTIESVLGNVREALIVDPTRAKDAVRIQRYESKGFRRCHVVNTTKTAEWSNLRQKGSLAELVTSDNPNASAFINMRLGSIMQVETEADLLKHKRAATADLMLHSGGTVTGMQGVDPILGWKHDEDIKKTLEHKLRSAEAEKCRLEQALERIDKAANCLANFERNFSGDTPTFAQLFVRRDDLAGQAQNLGEEISLLESREDKKLLKLIESLYQTIATLNGKLSAAKEMIGDKNTRRGVLLNIIETQEAAANQFTLRINELHDVDGFDPAAASDILDKLRARFADEKAPFDKIIKVIDEHIHNKNAFADKQKTRVVEGLTVFLNAHKAQSIELGVDASTFETFEDRVAFITRERAKLEETTLAEYTARADRALAEVEVTFRNKFISHLIDKIQRVHESIAALNSILKKRSFHGETYKFHAMPNVDLKDILDFAEAMHSDMTGLNIGGLFDPTNDPTSPHHKAIKFINEAFQDDDQARLIQDYRNYFVFNVDMYNSLGEKVSDLKFRVSKGSGGENMTPFYVAIGSSLSSAFKIVKRHNGTFYSGMNLAPFDEAFSKLDTENCYNCLEFLKDVGLQVLLAAPDEKYTTLAGQVDTVVWIYRDGGDIQIEHEAISRKAHDLLMSDHPTLARTGQVAFEPAVTTQAVG